MGDHEDIFRDQATQWEAVIAGFEEAWRQGRHPAIDECLPDGGVAREQILIELVHVELELRLIAGEAARVEEYLSRYPELQEQRHSLLELIVVEYEIRVRIGEAGSRSVVGGVSPFLMTGRQTCAGQTVSGGRQLPLLHSGRNPACAARART